MTFTIGSGVMCAFRKIRRVVVSAGVLVLILGPWTIMNAYATEPLWSSQAVVRQVPGEGFQGVLGDLTKTSPKLRASVCNSIYVIFIPGILGTKLEKADGTVVWGEGRPKASDLDLGTNPNLRPMSTLE